MSKTLENYRAEDLALYFNGCYVRRLSKDDIVQIAGFDQEEDGTHIAIVRTGRKSERASIGDLCQFWPETRGYNVRFGNEWHGVYLSRYARRATRRSVTRETLRLFNPRRNNPLHFDTTVANEANSRENYCGLSINALREWLALREGASIYTVAVGKRLLYVPQDPYNPREGSGALYYGTMGLVGSVELATGKYIDMCDGPRLQKRSMYSIVEFLK